MQRKNLHIFPEQIDREKYIIPTFFIELYCSEDIIKFTEVLAIDMSTGTWTPVEGETEEMREKYGAKVVTINEVPGYESFLPNGVTERRYVVSFAIPFENIGNQIPMLLTTIIGNTSVMGKIKLLDLEFPTRFLKELPGPKFGISGIREILGIPKRPLLNNMIKPCTGFTPQVGADFFYKAAAGGVDIIKDDELISETPYNRRVDRVRLYMEKERKAYKVKGEKTLYCVNITDRVDKLKQNAMEAIEVGANALMLNYLTVGISALRCLAGDKDIQVPILAHLDFSGVLYGNPYGGISSHLVLGKLARIAGADMVIYPIDSGKYKLMDERYRQIAYDLTLALPYIKPALPIPSGGLSPKIVPKIMNDLGLDCTISAGGAIHGHPMGAEAGAKAFRQAIDVVLMHKDLKEYAKENEELRVALEKWE